MSGAEIDQPGGFNQTATEAGSRITEPNQPDVYPDEMNFEPLMRAEKLLGDIERFSNLSSELTQVMLRLSREIKISSEQLNRIRSEVESRKNELKTIRGIEASAAALQRITEDYRQQKESFERIMANQRTLWEEEKGNRAREEKEYLENLRMRREREEEENRQKWAAEKLKAQQKLDEELKAIQQESLEKQQALERDCLQRELILKEKELEWVQLIQELEQFMSKLTRRTQAHAAARPGEAAAQPAFQETASSEQMAKEPGEVDSISSLKEMLVSQGRRIETLKE